MVILDLLDKRIIQHLSNGIYSYEELAKECNVTRNTIYRRITTLEKNGIIKKITRATVNYDKLNLSSITIGLNTLQKNEEQILATFKMNEKIKFIFRTYGSHNIIMIAVCDRGQEGQTINDLKSLLERFNIKQTDISISFTLEKIDFRPFTIENELKTEETQVGVINNIKGKKLLSVG